MRIYLTEQRQKLSQHLEALKGVAEHAFDHANLAHQYHSVPIPHLNGIPQTLPASFASYRIFPHRILSALPEWSIENREMRIGDTIAQLIHMPPTQPLGTQSLMGVRISAIQKEPHAVGFAYRTLRGHVEIGESWFRLRQREGQVCFEIETWSKPSGVLPGFSHAFARRYQAYCTKQALRHVARNLRR